MVHGRITAQSLFQLMESGELHSRIIRDVACIEIVLNQIVAGYFTSPERLPPFSALILDRFTVWTKVTIIEQLPYRGRLRSLRHIEVLKDIIQARNFLAHTHSIAPCALPPSIRPWLYLLTSYPGLYETHLRAVRRMLRSLLRTRDIGGPGLPVSTGSARRRG